MLTRIDPLWGYKRTCFPIVDIEGIKLKLCTKFQQLICNDRDFIAVLINSLLNSCGKILE